MALEEFLMAQGVKKTVGLPDIVREMNQKFHADDAAYYAIPTTRQAVAQLLYWFTGNLGNMALVIGPPAAR